jgi:hypothetical protein
VEYGKRKLQPHSDMWAHEVRAELSWVELSWVESSRVKLRWGKEGQWGPTLWTPSDFSTFWSNSLPHCTLFK